MTVVPARWTGATIARGSSTPVRPTCTTISSNTVSLISGGYLKAAAQRGNFAVLPSGLAPGQTVELHDGSVDIIRQVIARLAELGDQLLRFVHIAAERIGMTLNFSARR